MYTIRQQPARRKSFPCTLSDWESLVRPILNGDAEPDGCKFKCLNLIDVAEMGIAVVETGSWNFIKTNRRYKAIFGYTSSEFCQKNLLELIHPDSKGQCLKVREMLIREGVRSKSVDVCGIKKGNQPVWLRFTLTLVNRNTGQYMVSILQDVSKIRQAEVSVKEEQESFRTTMNSIDAIVYVADMVSHELLFINRNFIDTFGNRIGEKCYKALQGREAPCEFCTNHLLVNSKGEVNSPYVWEFRNLVTKKWYQCRDQAIRWMNGKLVRLEIASDITERKWNEQKLKKNEQKFRKLSLAKDKLFSIIAHDLKNPFSSLFSSSELLSIYLENNNLSKAKAKARIISEAIKQEYALLETLLYWAKSQSGTILFKLVRFNFEKFVSEYLSEISALAENKGIKIITEIPDDLFIHADRNLLQIILRNLMMNAIKFTRENGFIAIKAKQEKGTVEIAVVDSGIGISEEDQRRLFRLEDVLIRRGTAEETGSGLGLILCKELIEKHKGQIWVESEAGKGSAFKFTIPSNKDISEDADCKVTAPEMRQLQIDFEEEVFLTP